MVGKVWFLTGSGALFLRGRPAHLTTLSSLCFFNSQTRFSIKTEINRFLYSSFIAVCLWNAFLSLWVHSFNQLRGENLKQKALIRDFPGSPVVKTSPSNSEDVISNPGQGVNIPHAFWPKQQQQQIQSIKQKQYYNNSRNTFKNSSTSEKKKPSLKKKKKFLSGSEYQPPIWQTSDHRTTQKSLSNLFSGFSWYR